MVCNNRERGRTRVQRPRQLCTRLMPVLVAGCACFPVPVFADFAVSQWELGVYVDAEPGPSDGRGFYEVQNPFTGAHSASIAEAQAAAQYDISWLVNYGSFNISAQLAAQDGNSVRSLASGTVWLESDLDLVLDLDSALNYNLPTYNLGAWLTFAVRDLTANQYLFNETVYYETLLDPPGTGLLTNVGDVALPAGHQFRVQYELSLDTWGSSTGLATGDGYANWTLEPTPEPSSFALLAAVLSLCRLRPTRRLQSPRRRIRS